MTRLLAPGRLLGVSEFIQLGAAEHFQLAYQMRFLFLTLALCSAPCAVAQSDLGAELATADSITTALARFGQAFMDAGLSVPDSVDVLGLEGWDDVRERGVGVMSAVERGFGWSQVLPLMECDSDKRVVLVQLGLTAGQLQFRASMLADALAVVTRGAVGTGAEDGLARMQAVVTALETDLRRTTTLAP